MNYKCSLCGHLEYNNGRDCVDSVAINTNQTDNDVDELREQISRTKQYLADLEAKLCVEQARLKLKDTLARAKFEPRSLSVVSKDDSLSVNEIKQFYRQIILPSVGIVGQINLKKSSVLIIGVGGLGCPAAMYLGAAGIGTLGLVDGDKVEVSNLHRQILHNVNRVGQFKVESAAAGLKLLNPYIICHTHATYLTHENAMDIITNRYDIVLDCSDNPDTRTLISDVCVLKRLPVISGAALGFEGHMMLLNYPPLPAGDVNGGPCFRCVYPTQDNKKVKSCSEAGIFSPVVGIIGLLQAYESIRMLMTKEVSMGIYKEDRSYMILLSDIHSSTGVPLRRFRLRKRRVQCIGCSGAVPFAIRREKVYEKEKCDNGMKKCLNIEGNKINELTISAKDYAQVLRQSLINLNEGSGMDYSIKLSIIGSTYTQDEAVTLLFPKPWTHVLIDVREASHFAICSIRGSVNVPLEDVLLVARLLSPKSLLQPLNKFDCTLRESAQKLREKYAKDREGVSKLLTYMDRNMSHVPIYFICTRGNDSQIARDAMCKLKRDWCEYENDGTMSEILWIHRSFKDIEDGFDAWRRFVDPAFPQFT